MWNKAFCVFILRLLSGFCLSHHHPSLDAGWRILWRVCVRGTRMPFYYANFQNNDWVLAAGTHACDIS